jgi:integrase
MARERREYGTGSLLRVQYKDASGETHETKTWYMQFYDRRGKRHRESAKTENKQEAQARLTARLAEVGAGRFVDKTAKGLKFETVIKAWLYAPRGNDRELTRITMTDGTVTAYGLPPLVEFFAGYDIDAVSRDAMKEFIEHRRAEGIADPTIRRNLTVLRSILNYAHDCEDFNLPVVPSFKHILPKDSKSRTGFIDAKTFEKFVALLPEKCRPLARFQFATGIRTGSALALTWDMVRKDGDSYELNLPAELLKNDEPLTLPLVGADLEQVAAWMRKQFAAKGKQVFAVGRDGSKSNGKETYRYYWNRAAHALDLGKLDTKTRHYEGFHPHDLRRTAVKNMVDAGIPRKVAMQISGHKTEHIFNRYHIVGTEDAKRALIKTAQHNKQSAK